MGDGKDCWVGGTSGASGVGVGYLQQAVERDPGAILWGRRWNPWCGAPGGVRERPRQRPEGQVCEEEEEGAPAWAPGEAALPNASVGGWPGGNAGRAPGVWGLGINSSLAVLGLWVCLGHRTWSRGRRRGPWWRKGSALLIQGFMENLLGENPLPVPWTCPHGGFWAWTWLLQQEGGRWLNWRVAWGGWQRELGWGPGVGKHLFEPGPEEFDPWNSGRTVPGWGPGSSHWGLPGAGHSSSSFYFLNLVFGHAPRHVGSLFPDQGLNLCPLQWKRRVLTTGPPGKSLATPLLTPPCCDAEPGADQGWASLHPNQFPVLPPGGLPETPRQPPPHGFSFFFNFKFNLKILISITIYWVPDLRQNTVKT